MRPLIAGNWKMNGTAASLGEIDAVAAWVAEKRPAADVLICPPFTLISRAAASAAGRIAIGGQDCHSEASGAFTGDVSAEMLKDAGATSVIVGHSERRHYHHETNAMVAAKAWAGWRAGLFVILCVGETEAEHDAGRAREVVSAQLDASVPDEFSAANLAIAYEPIWAIGSGRTPSTDEIAGMHDLIRARLVMRHGSGEPPRILYGGSVKPANAGAILTLPSVDGALVGGASLKAHDFLAIIQAGVGAT